MIVSTYWPNMEETIVLCTSPLFRESQVGRNLIIARRLYATKKRSMDWIGRQNKMSAPGCDRVFLSHELAREEKQAGCVAIRKMRGSVSGGKQNVLLGLHVLGVTSSGRARCG